MIASHVRLAAALLAGVAHVSIAPAQAQAQQGISIPAQPLDRAIQQLMAQTNLLISYPSSLSSGKRSAAISGEPSPVAALSRLLAGTGLAYRQTGTNSFTLEIAPVDNGNSVQLGTLRVDGGNENGTADASGTGTDRSASAEAPYRKAGSSAHISREQIQRIPPTSTGDMFLNTPGIASAGNRNGQSLDLNIRGLQGMGRVATLIDGAAQQSSTYRGYGGTSSRTFIDPDLVGGIDVSKGPSDGSYGGGAMGGVVNMRTLIANDLIADDKNVGVRVKVGIADNSVEPPATLSRVQSTSRGPLTTDSRNLSIVGAVRDDNFELVAGYVERRNGNYVAGTKGNDRTTLTTRAGVVTEHPISLYGKGKEVFNTLRDTQAGLLKGTARFGDGHVIELGYVRYDSEYGEEYPDANNPFSQWSWIEQSPLSTVVSNIYTAKYRWNPENNPLINLRAEAWISDVDDFWGAMNLSSKINTKGAELWNQSLLGTAFGELDLRYGGQYSVEKTTAATIPAPPWGDNSAFDGTRKLGRIYANADLDVTEWFRLSGGLAYEFYKTSGTNWRNAGKLGLDGDKLNPRAAVTITPADGIQLFMTYAQGWRPATIRETLLDMDSLIRPNPLLRPENSRNIEFGANFLQDGVLGEDRLKTKLVYFDNRYTDFIMREYGTSFGLPTNYRTYTNIPEVKFRGIEASVDYEWRNLFLTGQFSYYTDVQFCNPSADSSFLTCAPFTSGEDYKSEAVPAKYSGAVTLGGRFFSDRLTLGGRTVFAGNRAVGRISSVQSDWSPYTVFDLFAGLDIGENLSFNASVENLTNRYYLDALSRARTPSPGRLVRLSVTGRFGAPERSSERPSLPRQSRLAHFDGDWSGFYVGAASGFAELDADTLVTRGNGTASAESGIFEDTGLTFAAIAGYNWQLASGLVLGLEADAGKSTSKGSYNYLTTETTSLASYNNVEAVYDSRNLWHGSLRGRVGQSMGRFLLFGTAGLAIRRDQIERDQYIANVVSPTPLRTVYSLTDQDRKTHLGWVAGLGGELAISNRWAIRAEYQRSDFGSKSYQMDQARTGVLLNHTVRQSVPDPITGVPTVVNVPVVGTSTLVEGRHVERDAVAQAIRLGISYRF